MQPQVITGARGPRELVHAKRSQGPVAIPDGKRVYQAVAARYQLQLTAPGDERLPDGRILRGKKPLKVMFSEFFVTLDEAKDAEAILMLEEHPDFGRDFWNFQAILDSQKEARINQALEVLRDPDARQAITQALAASGDDDFKLPPVDRAKLSDAARK